MSKQAPSARILACALSIVCAVPAASLSAPSPIQLEAPPLTSLRVADLLTEPLVDAEEDGVVWVRNRRARTCFEDGACVVHPVFGPDSEREWPVRFELRSAARGEVDLDVTPTGPASVADGRLEQPRGALMDVYHLRLDEIEQTFVFDELPGVGDLVLAIDVETDLPSVDGEQITFRHARFGGVTYGRAFAVDGAGRRVEIERSFDGDTIRLVVPQAFLANATLPLTVDPPISTFGSTPSSTRATSPDITFAGASERYFVCWEDVTSGTNSDVYLTSFDRAGSGGGVTPIEIGNQRWKTPRIAHIPAGNRLLVVAQARSLTSPATAILGRLASSISGGTIGTQFIISETSFAGRFDPDVGGTNRTATTSNHFLVAWSRSQGGTTALRYRTIDWTGAPISTIQTVASASGERASQVAVSESHGDSSLFGDLWTIAWIRDVDGDGLGQVWARRVVWNGNPTLGTGNFVVDPRDQCSRPSVTSRLDEPVFGDRPSIVAYECRNNFTGVTNSSIYTCVVIDGTAYTPDAISNVRQDLPNPLLDQTAPSIAADGSGFLLTYLEDGFSQDTYMLSGNIVLNPSSCSVALAERGARMTGSSADDVQCRVATIQDGDASSVLDDGACVWLELLPGGSTGRIRGTTLDIGTSGSPTGRAVGSQYCDAAPNASGRSSWLAIFGNQSRSTIHQAVCLDVTPDAFGYLLCADFFGNINMPGGSAGRLCLSGNIGRYASLIQSSGAAGRFDTSILPPFLPQPNGTVSAAVGETWFFQYWHRDTVGGVATSNFSNACALYFVN